jgi:peroxiredoxin
MLQPGTKAPDFTLPVTPDQSLQLSAITDSHVALVFYPADWSPVCGDEIALFNQARSIFERYHCQLVGISVDNTWCHIAYAKASNVHFPLLADFEPKGAVSRLFGVYHEHEGTSARALFLIDKKGIIQYAHLSPDAINPGADGILEKLKEIDQH